jgi:hypothetical protein
MDDMDLYTDSQPLPWNPLPPSRTESSSSLSLSSNPLLDRSPSQFTQLSFESLLPSITHTQSHHNTLPLLPQQATFPPVPSISEATHAQLVEARNPAYQALYMQFQQVSSQLVQSRHESEQWKYVNSSFFV